MLVHNTNNLQREQGQEQRGYFLTIFKMSHHVEDRMIIVYQIFWKTKPNLSGWVHQYIGLVLQ